LSTQLISNPTCAAPGSSADGYHTNIFRRHTPSTARD
jgi:hypothetical protein